MTGATRRFVSAEAPDQPRAGAGGRPCQGLYHQPDAGASTAVIATHYEVDFSEHYLADYMAARGIGFLGWNTRYRGNAAYFNLARAITDIGIGVRWLREEAGVDNVVLLGNSGGASLMSAYQAKGTDPADAFISLNAHPGRPDVLTNWLDPSVTDETDPLSRDPGLDMFDPANGPPYAPEFVELYRAAQVARNHRISDWCRAELERLGAGGTWDRIFAVPRTWADLRFLDLSLDPSDRAVGCYGGDARFANGTPFGLATANTCRAWLEMWSLADSDCRAEPHLRTVDRPSLVVQSTADQGCYPSDARTIFEAIGTADKELHLVPGAHYFESGGRDEVADLLCDWLGRKL